MNKINYKYILPVVLTIFVIIGACNQKDLYPLITAPTLAEIASGNATFDIGNDVATPTYQIPIGLTAKTNKDITINVSVSSPTGAVNGQQYVFADSSIVIKAGTVLDSLPLTASFAEYDGGRVDTLVFSISQVSDGVPILGESKTIRLVLRKFCTVIIDDFLGNVEIDDPSFWEDVDPGVVTKVNSTTINVAGFFGEPSYNCNIIINSDGSAVVNKQVLGPTLPGTSYTNPAVAGKGKYDACNQILSLTLSYSVTQGTFSGSFPMTIHR